MEKILQIKKKKKKKIPLELISDFSNIVVAYLHLSV